MIPMLVLFDVSRVSISTDVRSVNGVPCEVTTVNLVLVAERATKIHLADGTPLCDVAIPFSIRSDWGAPRDLEMADTEVGFLFHGRTGEQSSVHGAALWPAGFAPQYLMNNQTRRTVSGWITSLAAISETGNPFIWQAGAEHTLRFSQIGFASSELDLA